MDEELKYRIGLTLIPGIGDVLAKNLIAYCGSAEAVFKEKKAKLIKIPGIGAERAEIISGQKILTRAEEEIEFIKKHKIKVLFYADDDYPKRLKHCPDSPTLLYYKSNADLNATKVLSIVGTRNITKYGKKICEKLIEELAPYNILIISGMAYGVDICAHKAAVENNLPTVGVLAHGLDKLYPSIHQNTAEKMYKNGGLLTDFISKTKPDRENFPKRNRIVAGLADATVVIESAVDGGSLITAEIANSYNRDVFAFPGNIDEQYSSGCNKFIKLNKAALIESAADLIYQMGWEEVKEKKKIKQASLFVDLNPEEQVLVDILREKGSVNIDDLCFIGKLPMSKVSMLLLNLEFAGVIRSLPGKMYELN